MTSSAAIPMVAAPHLDRIIRWLLYIYIFALPFRQLLIIERNGFLLLLALLAVWCVVSRQYFFTRTPLDMPLLAFAGWIAITIPFASFPLYSLQEFGKLLQQGVIFYAVVYFFRARTDWWRLIVLIVGTSSIISLYGLTQFDGVDQQSVTSFLPAEVWLTTYLVMLIPLCFALTWHEMTPWLKSLYAVSTMLATACLFLTQSRAGLVAFFVELWAFVFLIKRRSMLIIAGTTTGLALIAALLLIKVVTTPDGSLSLEPRTSVQVKTGTISFIHRLDILKFMVARIVEHPIVGIGYGKETSKKLFGGTPEENLPPGHLPVGKHGAHNILLELALLVGIPGLVLFVWLAVCIVRMVVGGFCRATDTFAKAVLLGCSVSVIGLAVRVQFDQMLVGTLAVNFFVLMAVAVLAYSTTDATSRLNNRLDGMREVA